MKVLTEQELKETAEELGMDLSEVKMMYERALANGSQLGLKEFQEFAYKSNGGAANATSNDEDEYDDEDKKKVTKKEMVTILADLTEQEWKELEHSIQIAKALKQDDEMEDEEDMDEDEYEDKKSSKKMKGKKTKEQEAIESLQEQQKQMQELIMQQTKALTGLASAMVGGKQRSDLNDAVGDFFSTLPREQANSLLSSTKSVQSGTTQSDEAVIAKLKEIQDQVGKIQNPGSDIYNLFTSKKLNGGE